MSQVAVGRASCIVLSGANARAFAQAQFSSDVDALTAGHWQWSAWLDARGRVLALMQLADPGDGSLVAILRGGDAERTRAALARYVLRSQVTLAIRTHTGFAAPPRPEGTVATGPGSDIVLGYGGRSLRLAAVDTPPDAIAANDWRLIDIRSGWPVLPASASPGFLPPALGLERLRAVSFTKGCYPGQEIAARLHYRGGHKHRLYQVRGSAWLKPGDSVPTQDGDSIYVLDCASGAGACEALVVASKGLPSNINVLENIFNVVSTYDA